MPGEAKKIDFQSTLHGLAGRHMSFADCIHDVLEFVDDVLEPQYIGLSKAVSCESRLAVLTGQSAIYCFTVAYSILQLAS